MAATRLHHSWDSPGENTGVGCHFLLQCLKVKRESEVAQLCLTLSNHMDCSLPGSSSHGIHQAKVLEWVVSAFSVCLELASAIIVLDSGPCIPPLLRVSSRKCMLKALNVNHGSVNCTSKVLLVKPLVNCTLELACCNYWAFIQRLIFWYYWACALEQVQCQYGA